MFNKKEKKSQITIFVIIGLVIVIAIALLFTLYGNKILRASPEKEPVSYIQSCALDHIKNAVEMISQNAGYLEVPDLYVEYESEKIPYLCYSEGLKKICTNKEPMLIENTEREIEKYVRPKLEECFNSLKNRLKDNNYEENPLNFETEIKSNSILFKINRKISFMSNENEQSYGVFDISVNDPLYDFLRITNKIINEEVNCDCGSESCNADTLALEKENEYKFIIRKFLTGRDEEIFEITELESGKEFKFAIRNCVKF